MYANNFNEVILLMVQLYSVGFFFLVVCHVNRWSLLVVDVNGHFAEVRMPVLSGSHPDW